MTDSFKKEINDLLSKAEDIEQSIKNLTNSVQVMKECGGCSKLLIYNNNGTLSTTILTDPVLDIFVEALRGEYERILLDVQKEIDRLFLTKTLLTREINTESSLVARI